MGFLTGASAHDVADPAPELTVNPPDFFELGTTVVTFTTIDASGNGVAADATVTVQDTTAPVLAVPAPLTVEATATGAPRPPMRRSQRSSLVRRPMTCATERPW